jgi:hypothetical protein
MLSIVIPKDMNKITKQIKALEYQIAKDTIGKDKEIHLMALSELKKALADKL